MTRTSKLVQLDHWAQNTHTRPWVAPEHSIPTQHMIEHIHSVPMPSSQIPPGTDLHAGKWQWQVLHTRLCQRL